MTLEEKIDVTVDAINERKEKYNIEENSRPCEVCGSEDFVKHFRKVTGDISGHFSTTLFGGFSGYINGDIDTLPVLSCRKCTNERKIVLYHYQTNDEWFWNEMHDFYFSVNGGFKSIRIIDNMFLKDPIGTRNYMLKHQNWRHTFYNEMPRWETWVWAKVGFDIKPIKKTRKLLWLTWEAKERYPTWDELINKKLK